MVIFVFLIWHLYTFKYGDYYEYTVVGTGEVIRDLFRLLVEKFSNPTYVVGYSSCLIILGMHLSHGLSSSIRTLGFNHPKYDKKVRCVGTAYALIVLLGFASQPLFIFLTN
jgi:succinate dehydrogenase / fumarate reductase cytochrome b subunit